MSEPRSPREPIDRALLALCMRDIERARAALRKAHREGAKLYVEQPLRTDLLASLEAYAAVITRHGAPVPSSLRTELELYRALQNRW